VAYAIEVSHVAQDQMEALPPPPQGRAPRLVLRRARADHLSDFEDQQIVEILDLQWIELPT
jgi:hypothetical protein